MASLGRRPGAAIGRLTVDTGLPGRPRRVERPRASPAPATGRTFGDPLRGVGCAFTDGPPCLYAVHVTEPPERGGLRVVAPASLSPSHDRRPHTLRGRRRHRPDGRRGWGGTGSVPWPGPGREPTCYSPRDRRQRDGSARKLSATPSTASSLKFCQPQGTKVNDFREFSAFELKQALTG